MLEDIIEKITLNVILKFALADIVAAIPFLGFPVIGPVFSLLFYWLGGKIADALVKVAHVEIIQFETEKEKNDYEAAVNKLKVVISNPTPDPAEVASAKEQFKVSLHDLVRMRP